MAAPTSKTIGIYLGAVFGGFGGMILIVAIVMCMLVLSLIPIYTSNNSLQSYGEVYRISGLVIKAIYLNTTSANFTGGPVLDNAFLSAVCTAIYRAKGFSGFYSCLASNFKAYGPFNNTDPSTKRRRRSLVPVSAYEVGDIELLYSNTCGDTRAVGIWSLSLTSGKNNSCVTRRLRECKSFITSPTPNANGIGSNLWSPFPTAFTQVITSNITSCAPIAVSQIYNLPFLSYSNAANRSNVTTFVTNVVGDCELLQIVPPAMLQSYISNQFNTASNLSCT